MYAILSLHSYSILYPEMTAVIEIEFLQGNNEQVIKEAGIRADGGRACTIYSAHPNIWNHTVLKRAD